MLHRVVGAGSHLFSGAGCKLGRFGRCVWFVRRFDFRFDVRPHDHGRRQPRGVQKGADVFCRGDASVLLEWVPLFYRLHQRLGGFASRNMTNCAYE